MKNNIWDEFDKQFDTEGLAKDVESAASGGGYAKVPYGDYEVAVDKMELTKSKAGDPMLVVSFKILSDGDYKGLHIYCNQVVKIAFQIHKANELLRSFDSGHEVVFQTYKQYGNLIMDIHEAIDGTKEYALEYTQGKGDFGVFKITEVFDVED